MKNGFHFQFIFSKNNKKRFSNVHKHTCSVYMNRHICVEHLKKYPHKKEFNSWKKYYVRLCSLRSTALDMFLGSFELHERNYILLSSFYFFFIVVVYKWKIHAYTRRFWWYFQRKKERKAEDTKIMFTEFKKVKFFCIKTINYINLGWWDETTERCESHYYSFSHFDYFW